MHIFAEGGHGQHNVNVDAHAFPCPFVFLFRDLLSERKSAWLCIFVIAPYDSNQTWTLRFLFALIARAKHLPIWPSYDVIDDTY
jgi:hypothetical protein